MMLSYGTETLQTKNYLPGGKVAFTEFNNVKYVPGFGITFCLSNTLRPGRWEEEYSFKKARSTLIVKDD